MVAEARIGGNLKPVRDFIMARYTGPKCRLCRREGVKLFLKGARCEGPLCAITRRQQPPGQHGMSSRPPRTYGRQLREKQKVKRIYGVLETQFRRYYSEAQKQKADTGSFLLTLLERRLDNVLYRLGAAASRAQARQMLLHGKVSLNGIPARVPSIQVHQGDVIGFDPKLTVNVREDNLVPWLSYDSKKNTAEVVGLPERADIKDPIEEHLIVEYYSR